MKRVLASIFGLSILLIANCGGGQGNTNNGVRNSSLPDEFKVTGMVSSSTYQVFVTAFGNSEGDVKEAALRDAKQKAFNLILKEPFVSRTISDQGKKEIKNIIEENGKIVRLQKESGDTWSAVFQINKPGLQNHLKQLR
jgi:hypothetical protein